MSTHHDSDKHHRHSLRLQEYDYTREGAYFVTVCLKDRTCLFGDILDGKMILNDAGLTVEKCWNDIPAHFPHIELDEFVVMPNHVHGIIVINCRGESRIRPGDCHEPNSGDHKDRPYGTTAGSVGRIIQAFKSRITHEYVMGVRQQRWTPFNGKLWQRNYYEHIIRDDASLNLIRQYIMENPLRWAEDEENPAVQCLGQQ
jgi:REP element-mobilizing transposase RayT